MHGEQFDAIVEGGERGFHRLGLETIGEGPVIFLEGRAFLCMRNARIEEVIEKQIREDVRGVDVDVLLLFEEHEHLGFELGFRAVFALVHLLFGNGAAEFDLRRADYPLRETVHAGSRHEHHDAEEHHTSPIVHTVAFMKWLPAPNQL